MNSAIIRLSRKIIITTNESHPDLKQLWEAINNGIEDINKRRSGQRLSWEAAHSRYRQDIQSQASEYGEGILQFPGYRFPSNLTVNTHEKELKVETAHTEIYNFTEEINSLELHYFLIMEPIVLIDNIGNRLLVTKKELLESFLAIFAERDKYLKYHKGFGETSYVYVKQPEDVEKVVTICKQLPGVQTVLTNEEAAQHFHTMPSRIGDLVVIGDKHTVFGNLGQEREDLPANYRTHCSLHEATVPLLIYNAPSIPTSDYFVYNKDLVRWLY